MYSLVFYLFLFAFILWKETYEMFVAACSTWHSEGRLRSQFAGLDSDGKMESKFQVKAIVTS